MLPYSSPNTSTKCIDASTLHGGSKETRYHVSNLQDHHPHLRNRSIADITRRRDHKCLVSGAMHVRLCTYNGVPEADGEEASNGSTTIRDRGHHVERDHARKQEIIHQPNTRRHSSRHLSEGKNLHPSDSSPTRHPEKRQE